MSKKIPYDIAIISDMLVDGTPVSSIVASTDVEVYFDKDGKTHGYIVKLPHSFLPDEIFECDEPNEKTVSDVVNYLEDIKKRFENRSSKEPFYERPDKVDDMEAFRDAVRD